MDRSRPVERHVQLAERRRAQRRRDVDVWRDRELQVDVGAVAQIGCEARGAQLAVRGDRPRHHATRLHLLERGQRWTAQDLSRREAGDRRHHDDVVLARLLNEVGRQWVLGRRLEMRGEFGRRIAGGLHEGGLVRHLGDDLTEERRGGRSRIGRLAHEQRRLLLVDAVLQEEVPADGHEDDHASDRQRDGRGEPAGRLHAPASDGPYARRLNSHLSASCRAAL